MATETLGKEHEQRSGWMNAVSGRVALKESGVGVPDLVVAAFDLGAGGMAEHLVEVDRHTHALRLRDNAQAHRLGTVVTDEVGAFELTYDDAVGQGYGQDQRRPRLLLAVLAPDEPGATLESRLLWVSPEPRRNAGRTEQYIIRLTAHQLESAGIAVPGGRGIVDVVQGRLVRAGGGAAAGSTVELAIPGVSAPIRTRTGEDGRFTLASDQEGRIALDEGLVLRIHDALGGFQDVAVPQEATAGDLVVVVSEPPTDPRDQVARVVELVAAQDEAADQAKTALADRAEARVDMESATAKAVGQVLTAVGRFAGGDLTWKYDGSRPLAEMVIGAVEAGRTVLADRPRTVVADEGVLADGEVLGTKALTTKLARTPPGPDGVWRTDPLRQLRLRQQLQGPDGLPVPSSEEESVPVPPGGSDGAAGRAVPSTITDKVDALVEAMRLPEDPPLLGAGSAVSSPGAEVELARGIADVTAFHDVHELSLAMPDVWQEAFDRRLVAVVETAVRHVLAAGLPLDEPEGGIDLPVGVAAATLRLNDGTASADGPAADGSELTLFRLLDGLRRLDLVYSATSAHRIAPRVSVMRPPTTSLGRTVAAASGVLFKQGENYPDNDDGGSILDKLRDPFGEVSLGDLAGEHYRPTPRDLLQELEAYLTGQHAFTVFAAAGAQRALNFGVLLTWRQLWQPLSYQTGEIAHTMTLAPGEQRKLVTRRRRTLKRFTAEAEKATSGRSSESVDTSRAESEILNKATATTNFHLSSEGSTKLLVADGSFTTSTTRDVGNESSDTRRRFHEAVLKAAQEYREEHTIEVRTESEDVFEEESTVELSNPNREVALTAVLYTLQRRYHVSEHLHRARPVVLVAMPVPDPGEITTSWIIRYAWILSQSLLHQHFAAALQYLTTSYLGDKEILQDLQRAANEHEKALRQAEHRLGAARLLMESRGETLRELRDALARGDTSLIDQILEQHPVVGIVKDALDFVGDFLGGDEDEERRQRATQLLEAAEDDLARAEREAREAETQLAAASSAYQEAMRDLVRAKAESRNQEVRIAELRVHVSDNILHYMHAIWSAQPPDQRFFELHNVPVPVLSDNVRVVRTGVLDTPGVGGFTPEQFRVEFADDGGEIAFRPLVEVCNLHQLIGFLGNFAIFELLEGNALTDLILAPYLDQHEILRDPDDVAASWTLATLQEYADRLRQEVADGSMSQEEFDEQHAPFLRATLERLITEPRPTEDDVVIPSDSLYMELLTSGGTVIEPFQREHRAIDVARVREDQRHDSLDSLRRAALIHAGDLADPDLDQFERRLVAAQVATPGAPGGGDAPG